MAIPGQVTGVVVSKNGSRRFYLSYNKVVGSGYYIYLSIDGGLNYIIIKHVDDDDEINTQVGRVDAATEYYIKVAAFNAEGVGAASVPISSTTLVENIQGAWVGGGKKNYDANSMYPEEAQNLDSLRGEGTTDIEITMVPGGDNGQFQYNNSGHLYGTDDLKININTCIVTAYLLAISNIKSGSSQSAAGAVAGEIWKTAAHVLLPNNVLMIGV
jgi:hypothetical protein